MQEEQAPIPSPGEDNRNNSTTRISDSGTNSDSTSEGEIRGRHFDLFSRLPPELRFDVYRMAVFDLMNTIRTLCVYYGEDQHGGPLVVLSRYSPPFPRGLWQTHEEGRREVANYCFYLPVRSVVDVGANIINFFHGLRRRPLVSLSVGDRPFHQETTFFLDETTAVELFNQLHVGNFRGPSFAWLRSILVDRRTFQHLLCGYHVFSRTQGAPFTFLPRLRKIFVGFMYRWQDVALVEGPFDEVVTEIQVRLTPDTAEDEPSWTIYSPYHIHPILGTMIVSTVQQTFSEVESLREAGIEVGWCLIKTGITRRPDIIEWEHGQGI
ncbi:hypothetical protein DL766_002954 [Monosporascus sp. MC13-8B]|uniref:Uncharacterized protein n=1 Tax=Monosporascus cannonballus TaxID=155416 RepID=A0ABY0HJ49_9PEZI|nr:hypothetical protein DL763_010644 [Monosporascus cannonballus]RYO93715.1 hypothetical protein DL762_000920 [Monosporascus cannonballus]RYP34433.1 hypothetical protein DL766_002954 [Monosporascus sp. MC13-8B]